MPSGNSRRLVKLHLVIGAERRIRHVRGAAAILLGWLERQAAAQHTQIGCLERQGVF